MTNKNERQVYDMKSRIFNIMQYELHPVTKELLLKEDTIKTALTHKTIKRWAYIAHENDVYSEQDELDDSSHVQGTKKPKHWHIVIEMGSNQAETLTIARWFGIKENYIDCPKGHGAFLDCVEYLTHESEKQQAQGKYRYDDVLVKSNFDWRSELVKRAENKLKYGRDLTLKEQFRYDVLVNGKTLLQCQAENPLAYSDDMATLKKLRLEYLYNQDAPKTRINYYISGRGGLGKGLCSRALARSLFPDLAEDDNIFFEVGSDNCTFEGYDGQPVIIWNDMRAAALLKILGGRGNVFNVLDTHPTKARQNIKYGSINLCNTVNIINSVQTYIEFLDGLAGEYTTKSGEVMKAEDKGQSYRRMPFIINLHEEDFDLLVNKGFLENSANFQEFEEYKNICGNFQKVRTALKQNEEAVKKIENKMLALPKEKFDDVVSRESEDIEVTEDLLKQFEDYGTIKAETESNATTELIGVHSKNTFSQDEVIEILEEYKKTLKNIS